MIKEETAKADISVHHEYRVRRYFLCAVRHYSSFLSAASVGSEKLAYRHDGTQLRGVTLAGFSLTAYSRRAPTKDARRLKDTSLATTRLVKL
jgi:hypothetical protein